MLEWDPASKQPRFKHAAVRVSSVESLVEPRGKATIEEAARAGKRAVRDVLGVLSGVFARSHLGGCLARLARRSEDLSKAFAALPERHTDRPDLIGTCRPFAEWSRRHAAALGAAIALYGDGLSAFDALRGTSLPSRKRGGLGLLVDLQALWVIVQDVSISRRSVEQAARALRDSSLEARCREIEAETDRQLAWLRTRIDEMSAQALVVPS